MHNNNIKTFVVFDLETNDFPSHQFNKCSITEISLYAFSSDNVCNDNINSKDILKKVGEDGVEGFDKNPPELPRILHKLTLMVNPLRAIHPDAERVTGLSNYMLENESPFDRNTAECLNLFLGRLEGPICLVAHNGIFFDFPILRYVYDRIEMSLPSSVYCVDSWKAFREIDEKRENTNHDHAANKVEENTEKPTSSVYCEEEENTEKPITSASANDPLKKNVLIDWQRKNETTPQRKKKTEKRSYDAYNDSNSSSDSFSPADKHSNKLKARRSLFSEDYVPKTKYNKKGEYELGNIYKRCFDKKPLDLHRAESDVVILTKLILHYGLDFLAYAEERKVLFSSVPKLGTRIH